MQRTKEIGVFVDGVSRYFAQFADSQEALERDLVIGAPYLIDASTNLSFRYNGVISVTGDVRGVVVFTASSVLLKYILLSLAEPEISEFLIKDLVGEIANTIAGNARRELGSSFHISPPRVHRDKINVDLSSFGRRSFVLPIQWRKNSARLIVGLGKEGAV